MQDLTRLQKLWDAKLLTAFYTHPHWRIHTLAFKFMEEREVDKRVFEQLERTPILHTEGEGVVYLKNKDVYCFIAQHLPALYNAIEPRDIADLFDLLAWVKTTNPITKNAVPSKEDKNDIVKGVRLSRQISLATKVEHALFGPGSKANMAFFSGR